MYSSTWTPNPTDTNAADKIYSARTDIALDTVRQGSPAFDSSTKYLRAVFSGLNSDATPFTSNNDRHFIEINSEHYTFITNGITTLLNTA